MSVGVTLCWYAAIITSLKGWLNGATRSSRTVADRRAVLVRAEGSSTAALFERMISLCLTGAYARPETTGLKVRTAKTATKNTPFFLVCVAARPSLTKTL